MRRDSTVAARPLDVDLVDNPRKGAALDAVQIAEALAEDGYL